MHDHLISYAELSDILISERRSHEGRFELLNCVNKKASVMDITMRWTLEFALRFILAHVLGSVVRS